MMVNLGHCITVDKGSRDVLEHLVQENDRHRDLQHCPPFSHCERAQREDDLKIDSHN